VPPTTYYSVRVPLDEFDPYDLLDGEAARVGRFYAGLTDDQWAAPTRCEAWNRKDLLAHFCTVEDYIRAGLDGNARQFVEQGGPGAGYERLNDVLVARDARTPARELLSRFRRLVAEVHPRLRAQDALGTIDTSVGPYPVRRQTWYLASELAIHADDAGVPVENEERADRRRWRVAFAVSAVGEVRPAVGVAVDAGRYTVTLPSGQVFTLDDQEFVEAAAGRPTPRIPEPLRHELTVLA
jgi:uncharacterized protein (TIGR03083 family)